MEQTGKPTISGRTTYTIVHCQLTMVQIMPWDSDIDVQVTEPTMFFLAKYYNMSTFHYESPRIPDGRDYMLEVNPNFSNRSREDTDNVIDARWIDTTSGLFIDITAARYDLDHPGGEGMMYCKDRHEFRVGTQPVKVE